MLIYVSPGGSDAADGKTEATAKKTLAGALTAMGTGNAGVIVMDSGAIDAGSGASLSGYKCGLIGQGEGTHITATAPQAGPVIDLTGFLYPENAVGHIEFGGFKIIGDGVADPSRTHSGICFGGGSGGVIGVGAIWAHDISVQGTGGPGVDFGAAELCNFDRIVVNTPVGAKANDVPYMKASGAFNGNRCTGLGFRSTSASDDTGVSGALVVAADSVYAPGGNHFQGWFEYLHPPTSGCLVNSASNGNIFDFVFFDVSKETGATGTSFYTLNPTGVGADTGGNQIVGHIPGVMAGSPDTGVRVNQPYNSIAGVKGWEGGNVTIGSGVDHTSVRLSGSGGSADIPAVIDNSGLGWNNNNLIVDDFDSAYIANQGFSVHAIDDPTIGQITMGQGGAVLYNASGDYSPFFITTKTHWSVVNIRHSYDRTSAIFDGSDGSVACTLNPQDAASTGLRIGPASKYGVQLQGDTGPILCAGSGSPEGVLAAPAGSLYMRSDGGAGTSLYVKESGSGSTGWVGK